MQRVAAPAADHVLLLVCHELVHAGSPRLSLVLQAATKQHQQQQQDDAQRRESHGASMHRTYRRRTMLSACIFDKARRPAACCYHTHLCCLLIDHQVQTNFNQLQIMAHLRHLQVCHRNVHHLWQCRLQLPPEAAGAHKAQQQLKQLRQ